MKAIWAIWWLFWCVHIWLKWFHELRLRSSFPAYHETDGASKYKIWHIDLVSLPTDQKSNILVWTWVFRQVQNDQFMYFVYMSHQSSRIVSKYASKLKPFEPFKPCVCTLKKPSNGSNGCCANWLMLVQTMCFGQILNRRRSLVNQKWLSG
jgi:hypothetical protein